MKEWYRISAQKNRKAKILIYEQIGEDWWNDGVSAKKFITELNDLDVDTIDLYINSPGGSVFDGNSIYNALKRHQAEIHVFIDGIAASIASVIAMSGDTIEMPQNAMMMIHDPSGLVRGTAKDMIKMAEALDKVKTGMVAAYMTRATIDESDVAEMMAEETWMTAQEALDAGLADTVTEPVKMAASFQALANYKNVPDFLMERKKPTRRKTDKAAAGHKEADIMEITLELIQSKHPEIVNEILKTVDLAYVQANFPQIVAELEAEGAAKERGRIQAVQAQSMPGHEELIDELMFDGKTTGEQAAVKVLSAEGQIRAQANADHIADAPDPLKQPTPDDEFNGVDPNLPLEERCKAKWEKDANLRAEYGGEFDAYLAYEKAVSDGRVKVLGGK